MGCSHCSDLDDGSTCERCAIVLKFMTYGREFLRPDDASLSRVKKALRFVDRSNEKAVWKALLSAAPSVGDIPLLTRDDKNTFLTTKELNTWKNYQVDYSQENDVDELLFELAMADGTLHPEEERLLKETINIFKLNSSIFDELKSRFDGNSSDAYKVLGVDTHTSFNEIKKIYLKKRREFHPDTLVSKGLPDELLEKAKERFIEIQQAFEEIEEKNKNNN